MKKMLFLIVLSLITGMELFAQVNSPNPINRYNEEDLYLCVETNKPETDKEEISSVKVDTAGSFTTNDQLVIGQNLIHDNGSEMGPYVVEPVKYCTVSNKYKSPSIKEVSVWSNRLAVAPINLYEPSIVSGKSKKNKKNLNNFITQELVRQAQNLG